MVGYAPVSRNMIICLEHGTWSAEPKCIILTNSFAIFQRTSSGVKCLVANEDVFNDRNWVVSLFSSTDACTGSGYKTL